MSLYTGVPTIEIPIHTVKGKGGISLPLTLSYHASGIKVNDIASWVGLGWTLQGAGVITRSIRGLPDEEATTGYFVVTQNYTKPDDLSSPPLNSDLDREYDKGAARGEVDTEQDLYYINYPGKSYQLIFSGGSFHTSPFSNIKVVTDIPNNIWTITIEDGTILTFGTPGYLDINSATKFVQSVGGLSFTSSWYLKSIRTPTGAMVNFSYYSQPIAPEYIQFESDMIEYPLSGPSPCNIILDKSPVMKSSVVQTNQHYLKTIETDLERVEFDTAGRADLDGGVRLARIRVLSKITNEDFFQVDLQHDYSQAVSGIASSPKSKRLKLTQLSKGSNPSNLQVWQFEYNPQHLPCRGSYAQDHWGYFNGKLQNTTMLPKVKYRIPTSVDPDGRGFNGSAHPIGDREGNPGYMGAEMVSKITYPTKGYSVFEFEPNSTPEWDKHYRDSLINTNLNMVWGASSIVNSKSIPFEVTENDLVAKISLMGGGISDAILNDFFSASIAARIVDPNGNSVCTISGKQNISASKSCICSTPGQYTFKLSTNVTEADLWDRSTYVYVSASLQFDIVKNVFPKLAGGMRVKRIQDFPAPDAVPVTKTFLYEKPLVVHPVDRENDYLVQHTMISDIGASFCTMAQVIRNTTARQSIGSIQGGTIGYGKVTTRYGNNAELGQSVSYYWNTPDTEAYQWNMFPFPPKGSRETRRGLLDRQVDYKSDLITKVKTIQNTYDFKDRRIVSSMKIGYIQTHKNHPESSMNWLQRTFYSSYVDHVKRTQTSEIVYSQGNPDSLMAVTNYYFDNDDLAIHTKTDLTTSDGSLLETCTFTAKDKNKMLQRVNLSQEEQLAIDAMNDKNIVAEPVLIEVYKGGVLTDRFLKKHQVESDIVLLKNVEEGNAAKPLTPKVEFVSYDNDGNLLEQRKSKDFMQSYIYGYRNSLPIAHVTGASRQNIFHTSFEDDENNPIDNARTGLRSKKGPYYITLDQIDNGSYYLSYWLGKSGQWNPVTLPVKVINNSYTISIPSADYIDEVRFYPQVATMKTFSYGPFGITTITDENNSTKYFEYDEMGRLSVERDDQKNILRTFEYRYKK